MKKYRVKGQVNLKAEAEVLVLAGSPDEAWDLCEDHPAEFLNLATLETKACREMTFDVDDVMEIKTVMTRRA